MSDVCLLHAVLLSDAFEAKLKRVLTPQERQDLHDLAPKTPLEAIEVELEQAADAAAAAAVLQRARNLLRRLPA